MGVTNPASVFVGLVPLYCGAKYDYIFKHILIRFQINLGQIRFFHSSFDRKPQLNMDTLETQYMISLNLPSSKLIGASCIYKKVDNSNFICCFFFFNLYRYPLTGIFNPFAAAVQGVVICRTQVKP